MEFSEKEEFNEKGPALRVWLCAELAGNNKHCLVKRTWADTGWPKELLEQGAGFSLPSGESEPSLPVCADHSLQPHWLSREARDRIPSGQAAAQGFLWSMYTHTHTHALSLTYSHSHLWAHALNRHMPSPRLTQPLPHHVLKCVSAVVCHHCVLGHLLAGLWALNYS